MLHRRSNYVVALFTVSAENPLDGVVVGLSTAAGEDDFVLFSSQHLRQLPPGVIHRLLSGHARHVGAGGVAVLLVDIGQHGLGHLGVDGSCGVVVEINVIH